MESLTRVYSTLNYPTSVEGGKTLLTGIRKYKRDFYITGFYVPPSDSDDKTTSFIYKGNVCGDGKWYNINNPLGITNLYGPDVINKNTIRAVGSCNINNLIIACLYEGNLDGSGKWTTISPPHLTINSSIAHSVMGRLVVGNYSEQKINKAFIYDICEKKYYNIINPHVKYITAYGIWCNDNKSYTICGGYSDLNLETELDIGYVVDWNNKTHEFSNWRTYHYNNDTTFITHFNGISSNDNGKYYLTGDASVLTGESTAFICNIKRHCDKFFKNACWAPIEFPGGLVTSGNSISKTIVIGVYESGSTSNGYVSFII